MRRVDLGGVGRNGAWTTVNVDTSGYRPLPDICANVTAHAAELAEYFPPQSVDEIRCIHVLEHLPSWDTMNTLRYWRTFLAPGGSLLIVVPDLGKLAIDYADGAIPFEVFAAIAYVSGFRTIQGPGEEHHWGWSEDTLIRDLQQAGYSDVRPAGDEHWEADWLFDFPDMVHTGLVGRYRVANLRVLGKAR